MRYSRPLHDIFFDPTRTRSILKKPYPLGPACITTKPKDIHNTGHMYPSYQGTTTEQRYETGWNWEPQLGNLVERFQPQDRVKFWIRSVWQSRHHHFFPEQITICLPMDGNTWKSLVWFWTKRLKMLLSTTTDSPFRRCEPKHCL